MRALLFALCWTVAVAAHAQWAGWDYDNDREIRPWSELQAQIPKYPKDEELIRFDAGAASAHRFYVDPSSISIGEDGVVRYILVIRTAGGASNVSFEGIRCESREQKTYAVGQRDGSWTRARNPQWRRIEYQEVNRHYGVLYRDFFCRGKYAAGAVTEIVRLLKYPPLQPTND